MARREKYKTIKNSFYKLSHFITDFILAILCYNMHGDRMKKNIKVNYKSIFKYDDHHETVQFKSDGIYEKGFDKEKFTFYNNDQKIEIILKGKEMTLANGPSLLNLSYHRKIGNHYHTDYGMIELFTELITMEHDRYLKVKYILSDEHQQLSEVYVMMKYDFYGEENEAI